jgi:hypothetical protein
MDGFRNRTLHQRADAFYQIGDIHIADLESAFSGIRKHLPGKEHFLIEG